MARLRDRSQIPDGDLMVLEAVEDNTKAVKKQTEAINALPGTLLIKMLNAAIVFSIVWLITRVVINLL